MSFFRDPRYSSFIALGICVIILGSVYFVFKGSVYNNGSFPARVFSPLSGEKQMNNPTGSLPPAAPLCQEMIEWNDSQCTLHFADCSTQAGTTSTCVDDDGNDVACCCISFGDCWSSPTPPSGVTAGVKKGAKNIKHVNNSIQ